MPSREHFQNKLRELGYRHCGETENCHKWRKGTHFVFLKKGSSVSEGWAQSTLRQCGCDEKAIADFIQSCNM